MNRLVLDSRFFLMWLVPIVASFFSVERSIHDYRYILRIGFYDLLLFYLFYSLLGLIKYPGLVKFLKNTMLILSLSLAFIDFFVSYYFYMDFTPSLVGTILTTNARESYEFLTSMVFPHAGLILGYVVFCVAFLYAVRFKLTLSQKGNAYALGVLIAMFSLHFARIVHFRGGIHEALTHIPPVPLIKEISAIYACLHDYASYASAVTSAVIKYKGFKPYTKDYLSTDKDSVPNVVLIIGESASRNFMGVYGYSVPDTPFLSSLQERERERDRKIYLSLAM
ncbi:sulfatase-like hydrolase/transferase [Helicobacter suis]|uniref:sulfatase-like hydrolase/transferase n=1 Tax=Helicobacter suis TaxID=104628 RepID=UPI00247FFE63|nr:sulfatase-like hydrolase/transferase [Helicobacter suis]